MMKGPNLFNLEDGGNMFLRNASFNSKLRENIADCNMKHLFIYLQAAVLHLPPPCDFFFVSSPLTEQSFVEPILVPNWA